MSLNKFSLAGNTVIKLFLAREFDYSRPGRVWFVISRLWIGKTITFFTVYPYLGKGVLSTYVSWLSGAGVHIQAD
jgi:hypothetical protein